jgi:hypothetical protein
MLVLESVSELIEVEWKDETSTKVIQIDDGGLNSNESNIRFTHLCGLGVLETVVDGNTSPVDVGLVLHVPDDGVEQEGLTGRGLLAAIGINVDDRLDRLAGGSLLGSLGRHLVY